MFGFPSTVDRTTRNLFSYRKPFVSSRGAMTGAGTTDALMREVWAVAGNLVGAYSTLATTAHGFYAMPFVTGNDSVVDKISIRCTTAGSGSATYWGLYDSTDDVDCPYPGQLLAYSSASTTTGQTGVKSLTCCVPLVAGRIYWGWVWIGGAGNFAAPTLRAMTATGAWNTGGIDTGMGAVYGSHLYKTITFDYVRSVAPPDLVWDTANSTPPTVALRMSA